MGRPAILANDEREGEQPFLFGVLIHEKKEGATFRR